MSKRKGNGPKWTEKDYRAALMELRKSGLYRDLDPAHGYDLRPGKKLSFGAKMQIRKLTAQMATITARSNVLVTPRTKAQERALKKTMGVKSGKLKKIPVPVLPNQEVRVKLDVKTGRVVIDYPALGLKQVVCPLDLKKISKNIDYSMEETEQKDALVEEYFREVVKAVSGVDDGNAIFRIFSRSGDINPSEYARTQFLDDLRDYFERMVNRYSDFDDGEINLLDFISGISVWLRVKGADWNNVSMNATGYDYTAPLRLTYYKDGSVKAKRVSRHVIKRTKKSGSGRKK